MRLMWICNIPIIKMQKEKENRAFGGWMTALARLLLKRPDIRLTVCYPQDRAVDLEKKEQDGILFYGFYTKKRNAYDSEVVSSLQKIREEVRPDLIHIFGTEFPHTLAALKLEPDRTLISIQGLIGVYAKHYFAGIPAQLALPGFCGRRNPMYQEREQLRERGRYECAALKRVKYITGRTEWDYACVQSLNPNAKYFFLNEALRDSFYGGTWRFENCKKHSVFISQADYPVKGFHIFLKALRLLIKKYPDICVFVAGYPPDLEHPEIGGYHFYIKKMMQRFHLEENIRFVGLQDEKQMCRRYLNANVFVMPSLIENSPNSLGEAMMLGVPCIVANVGGVGSMITHGLEGFLYQADAEYMLAYYMDKIFENPDAAQTLSGNARKRANATHDREKITQSLLQIYEEINREAGMGE